MQNQSGLAPIQIILSIIAGTIILGGVVGGVLYFGLNKKSVLENPDLEHRVSPPQGGNGGYFSAIGDANFSKCGKTDQFREEYWYGGFIFKVKEMDFYTLNDAELIYSKNQIGFSSVEEIINMGGKDDENNVSEICTSDNGYLIATIAGQYGGAGFKVVRYDIENNIIEIAKREDVDGGQDTPWHRITHDNFLKNAPQQVKDIYRWFSPPYKFGNTSGKMIELLGFTGDAGCRSSSFYDYDVVDNYVNITKRCSKCESDPEEFCKFSYESKLTILSVLC